MCDVRHVRGQKTPQVTSAQARPPRQTAACLLAPHMPHPCVRRSHVASLAPGGPENTQPICYEDPQIMNSFVNGPGFALGRSKSKYFGKLMPPTNGRNVPNEKNTVKGELSKNADINTHTHTHSGNTAE